MRVNAWRVCRFACIGLQAPSIRLRVYGVHGRPRRTRHADAEKVPVAAL